MKENTKAISKDLYKTLCEQRDLIDSIYEKQKKVRASVVNKDWPTLESTLESVDTLSHKFTNLEVKRINTSLKLNKDTTDDIFEIVKTVPNDMKVSLIEVFQQVKRSLLVSKIENDSIYEYIRVTQNFMQKVFDEVLPQRRNTLYSSKGEVIKNQPTSVLLDTVA